MHHQGPGASISDLLAELMASRNLTAELRRRVEARDLRIERIKQDLQLAHAIRHFAHLISHPRVLLGLTGSCLLGRTVDVRCKIEDMLRQSDIPPALDILADWITKPRIIFGLTRRLAFGGRVGVKGLIVLVMEQTFDISHYLLRSHADG